jgi:ABC-type nitrate/sulfonate/bicarbonate transport system substrate-binding protein
MGKAILAVTILAGMMAASSPLAADPLELKIQWSVAPSHMTPLLPEAPKGIYRHYGKTYTISPQRMRGSGAALQAIAANELHLGGISPEALALGVAQAKIDLVAIAQVMTTSAPGYATSEFYGRVGDVKTFEDVKGKTVAVNSFGGSIDAAVMAMAKRTGLKRGTDFQVVEVRFPAMLGALEKGRVALVPLVTPFNFMAQRKGGFQKVFEMRDALGAWETLTWIGRRDWIQKNRAVLVDFLEDNIRFRTWLLDPKNRKEVLELVSKVTKRPVKSYEGYLFTTKDSYRDPRALVSVERMAKNIKDLNDLGIINARIDVAKNVDNSLAQEAAGRVQ